MPPGAQVKIAIVIAAVPLQYQRRSRYISGSAATLDLDDHDVLVIIDHAIEALAWA